MGGRNRPDTNLVKLGSMPFHFVLSLCASSTVGEKRVVNDNATKYIKHCFVSLFYSKQNSTCIISRWQKYLSFLSLSCPIATFMVEPCEYSMMVKHRDENYVAPLPFQSLYRFVIPMPSLHNALRSNRIAMLPWRWVVCWDLFAIKLYKVSAR